MNNIEQLEQEIAAGMADLHTFRTDLPNTGPRPRWSDDVARLDRLKAEQEAPTPDEALRQLTKLMGFVPPSECPAPAPPWTPPQHAIAVEQLNGELVEYPYVELVPPRGFVRSFKLTSPKRDEYTVNVPPFGGYPRSIPVCSCEADTLGKNRGGRWQEIDDVPVCKHAYAVHCHVNAEKGISDDLTKSKSKESHKRG